MPTYRVQGFAYEGGVAGDIRVLGFKGDRGAPSSLGELLFKVTPNASGWWQAYFDDWAGDVCVLVMDYTGTAKKKSKTKDWVVGTLASPPALSVVNSVVNGNFEGGTMAGWTVSNAGASPILRTNYASMFGSYVCGVPAADSFTSDFQWVAIPVGTKLVRASFWAGCNTIQEDHSQMRVDFFQVNQTTEVGTRIILDNQKMGGTFDFLQGESPIPAGAAFLKVWVIHDLVGAGTQLNAYSDEIWIQFDPTDTPWPGVEPHAANVESRLTFAGADGATSVTDLATVPPSWTFHDAAEISAGVNPFGTGNSLRLEGGTSAISTSGLATSALFTNWFLGSSFTVRFWWRSDRMDLPQGVLFLGDITQELVYAQVVHDGHFLRFQADFGGTMETLDRSVESYLWLEESKWHFFTLMKAGGGVILFIDGKVVFSVVVANNESVLLGTATLSPTTLRLGEARLIGTDGGRHSLVGNIADWQFIDGVAAHPIQFTPPKSALPV